MPACGWGHVRIEIRQTLRFGGLTPADWTGSRRAVFETAYGISIGVYHAGKFQDGATVTSTLGEGRRSGLGVGFTAVVAGIQTARLAGGYMLAAQA